MTQRIRQLIEQLEAVETGLYQQDFLLTWEQPMTHIRAVLLAAEILEELYRANISTRAFQGGLAISIFRDKSTRTRFSFASAASLLGLSLVDLDESKTQVAHGETVRETANMISFLTEVVGIRDDMFLGEGHEYQVEFARSVEAGFRDGILPQRPAVLNLQCDRDHPTQTLADLMHLQKTFGSLEVLRGKKIAMTWAYSPSYGKPLSVPQGIITLMTRLGMEVVLAHPEGYDLIPEAMRIARWFASESGGSFQVVHSMAEAFENADIVYPKSWAPYQVMERRTALLHENNTRALDELERECLEANAQHTDWECTEELMAHTRDGDGLYMHCLPADITDVNCEAGEVCAEVFDHYRTPLYKQAEHKLYVMAGMILLTRFPNPAAVLRKMLQRNEPRRIVV
jgi:knotted carbamoyltransferase YgeW